MSSTASLLSLLVLLGAAFLPALVYLMWVRTTEQGVREGWGTLLGAFAYGAFFATIIAGIVEAVLVAGGTSLSQAIPAPEFVFLNGNTTAGALFLILVLAPFVEEALKASGVAQYRQKIRVVADGPVLGAGVGLGFGFFETFLYGLGAYFVGGLAAGLSLIVLRSLSSILLHGSSTALFGYGYAEDRVGGAKGSAGRHYLAAVGLHSSFNAVVSLGVFVALLGVTGVGLDIASGLGYVFGVVLAFAAIEYVRRLIVQSSHPGALAAHPRFRPPPVRPVVQGPAAPRR